MNRYKCKFCSKSFCTSIERKKHQKENHNREINYKKVENRNRNKMIFRE